MTDLFEFPDNLIKYRLNLLLKVMTFEKRTKVCVFLVHDDLSHMVVSKMGPLEPPELAHAALLSPTATFDATQIILSDPDKVIDKDGIAFARRREGGNQLPLLLNGYIKFHSMEHQRDLLQGELSVLGVFDAQDLFKHLVNLYVLAVQVVVKLRDGDVPELKALDHSP